MSKYTTEVRFICESLAGYVDQQGYGKIDDILTTAAPLVFDFDFPIFDEDYRLGLEKKILRHFYTREISEESVGLWKLRLDERMNLIMPYFNQLYQSELIQFNPMHDTDLTTDSTTNTTGQTTGNEVGNSTTTGETTYDTTSRTVVNGSTTEKTVYAGEDTKNTTYEEDVTGNKTRNSTSEDVGTSKEVVHSTDAYSDTPQGTLSNVENLAYLTNARVIDETTTGNTTNDNTFSQTDKETVNTTGSKKEPETHDYTKDVTGTSETVTGMTKNEVGTSKSVTDTTKDETGTSQTTEEYIQHIVGKRSLSSFSTYLNQFRETFLNIDKMVIDSLNDLFFCLW